MWCPRLDTGTKKDKERGGEEEKEEDENKKEEEEEEKKERKGGKGKEEEERGRIKRKPTFLKTYFCVPGILSVLQIFVHLV